MRTAVLLALAGCSAAPLSEFSTNLGLVVVDTSGEEMGTGDSVWSDRWVAARIEVFDTADGRARIAGEADYGGPGAIHVRGNSSRDYDKRSFRIELRNGAGDDVDAPLLGMPAEADWVLQGPYSDKSLMRNHLMYGLSRDIGRYAPRTRFVELFVVDDGRDPSDRHYRGVYVLTERIERGADRVAIQKVGSPGGREPAIRGGYLLRRDWVDGPAIHTPVYNDVLLLEDPSEPTPAQHAYIEGYLGEFETALSGRDFTDPDKGYRAFVDVDAFIDHMLLVEMARDVDGYVLSTWMHKDRDAPLAMGPIWDFNGALGNADYMGAWRTSGWHYEQPAFPADNRHGFRWYERMLQDPHFVQLRADRWRQHRLGPLSEEAVRARISDARAELDEAAPRNFERWNVLGKYVWPNDEGSVDRESFDQEVDYLRNWLLKRLLWMDSELGAQ